jgi:hypothetical protein
MQRGQLVFIGIAFFLFFDYWVLFLLEEKANTETTAAAS